MIGLIDLDLLQSTSTQRLIPNLEIMKLAAYYREEQNTFCRLIDLNDTDFSSYDIIYLFSEKTNAIIPEQFKKISQLYLGGSGFTNSQYIPFENSIIDYMLPRPFIYKDFLKQKMNDGIKSKVISHILDDTYYRNYAGDKKLPLPAIKKRQRVWLFDRDFFYPDWEQTLSYISDKNPTSIFRIHPVICNNINNYFKLRTYPKFSRENEILLDFKITNVQEIQYLLKNYKHLFLADILPNTKVFIPFGQTQKTNMNYYKDLILKLNLLYSFWSYNIPIKMRYMPPSFGNINPIQELSLAIDKWSNLLYNKNGERNIEEKIILKTRETIEYQQEQKFLSVFPKYRSLFIQSYQDLSKRRLWKL